MGLAITMLVEVVVLKGDTGRSNMVFRFYNQAWFIFGIATAVSLIDLLSALPHWTHRVEDALVVRFNHIVDLRRQLSTGCNRQKR